MYMYMYMYMVRAYKRDLYYIYIYIYIYIYTLLTYKAYRYMITLLLCTNYLTVQIYNTE